MVFSEQQWGYDKAQVDRYIELLSGEYKAMQDEYEAILLYNADLSKECQSLRYEKEAYRMQLGERDANVSSQVYYGQQVAEREGAAQQALINAKAVAKSVLEKAGIEAARIKNRADEEAKQVVDNAKKEAERLVMVKDETYVSLKELQDRIASVVEGKDAPIGSAGTVSKSVTSEVSSANAYQDVQNPVAQVPPVTQAQSAQYSAPVTPVTTSGYPNYSGSYSAPVTPVHPTIVRADGRVIELP
ncbi:MAG: DivIVA domain-containing protein [Lachnospiraceae bacterium]|jgi:cell division septum initiation protein DivIVA|nr:DivIVA domain-containing protein [Lachnospiraceae bacterium]